MAQTKQDVPLVLDTAGHPDLESHGGGQGTCSREGCAGTEEEGRDGQEGSRSVCCPGATTLPRSVRVLHSYVSVVPLHTFLLFDPSFCNLLFIVLLSLSVFLRSVIYSCTGNNVVL